MNDTETKQINPGAEPFTTTDGELALSLLTAGCQFARGEEGGPAQMHFTPDVCRNRWVTVRQADGQKIRVTLLKQITDSHTGDSPEKFELAVMRAVKMGIHGIDTYYIVRNSVFHEAITMHDRLAKEAMDAAREERPMTIPPLHTLTEAAMIMTVCYMRRRNEPDMKGHAWIRPPNLAMGDVRKSITPRQGVPGEILEQMSYTASGSGKLWSLVLSDEKRAMVMSDGKPFCHPKPKLP